MFGLMLKSTHDAAMKRADSVIAAEVARANSSGKALREQTGELIDGMRSLGLHPEPIGETTAGLVIRHLRIALADLNARTIERDTAQRERDGYREDALKFRAQKSHLIPGGPFRGKGSRKAAASAALAEVA